MKRMCSFSKMYKIHCCSTRVSLVDNGSESLRVLNVFDRRSGGSIFLREQSATRGNNRLREVRLPLRTQSRITTET